MKCKQCGREFESTRADAMFCSTKCRKMASRIKCDNVSQIIEDVTDNVSQIIKSDKITKRLPRKEGDSWFDDERVALYVSECCKIPLEEARTFV